MQEDQDFAASTPQITAASELQKVINPVLKWNFPIVADIYKDVIKKKVLTSILKICVLECQPLLANGTNVYFFLEKSRNQVH